MRIRALHQQMCDAMRKCIGLARPRSCDHEQRAGCVARVRRVRAVLDRFALRVVQFGQVRRDFFTLGLGREIVVGGGVKRKHVAWALKTGDAHCISIQVFHASA